MPVSNVKPWNLPREGYRAGSKRFQWYYSINWLIHYFSFFPFLSFSFISPLSFISLSLYVSFFFPLFVHQPFVAFCSVWGTVLNSCFQDKTTKMIFLLSGTLWANWKDNRWTYIVGTWWQVLWSKSAMLWEHRGIFVSPNNHRLFTSWFYMFVTVWAAISWASLFSLSRLTLAELAAAWLVYDGLSGEDL